MAITGLHIPYADLPLAPVTVGERDVTSYYPYVSGGPAEAGHFKLSGWDLVLYVNSRYLGLDGARLNPRATALFELAGVGVAGGWIRGDSLLVSAADESGYERSLPEEVITHLLGLTPDP